MFQAGLWSSVPVRLGPRVSMSSVPVREEVKQRGQSDAMATCAPPGADISLGQLMTAHWDPGGTWVINPIMGSMFTGSIGCFRSFSHIVYILRPPPHSQIVQNS